MRNLTTNTSIRYIFAAALVLIAIIGIKTVTNTHKPGTTTNGMTTSGASTTGGATAAATMNATCAKTSTLMTTDNAFATQNNLWNASATGQQCIRVNMNSGAFTVTQANNAMPTNGAPASYPSIYTGCHWGNCTTNSHLPIQVSNIASVQSQWNIKTAPGAWDSAYDIWFNSTPNAPGQPDGAELMIWINHAGAPQPFGSQTGTASIAGAKWNVWSAYQGWNTISYVDTTPTESVNFDLKHFIMDAVARGQIKSSWYLTAVEAGFELWQGGAGMTSNAFTVAPVAANANAAKR